nr:hypothetical protein [Lysinibacillus timonensis]
MKKLLVSSVFVFSLGLAGCGDTEETPATNELQQEVETETDTHAGHTGSNQPAEGTDDVSWENKIAGIANSEGSASDKFKELETYLLESEVTDEEVERFKVDIVNEYERDTYLADIKNDAYMLDYMFRAYHVEQNNQGTPIGDFAFDMFQNMKNTYRGVDTVESEAVKANEAQMNEALNEIK